MTSIKREERKHFSPHPLYQTLKKKKKLRRKKEIKLKGING